MRKGWFKIENVQDGDRTVEDQLKGLDRLLTSVSGKVVLDLGCAEGLIGKVLLERGARRVFGAEVVPEAVYQAMQGMDPSVFQVVRHDLNEASRWLIADAEADVVLMLAILHKLRRPQDLLEAVLETRPGLIVIRLPPATAPVIADARSNYVRYDVEQACLAHGYRLDLVELAHFDEWTGYFVPC